MDAATNPRFKRSGASKQLAAADRAGETFLNGVTCALQVAGLGQREAEEIGTTSAVDRLNRFERNALFFHLGR